MTEITSSSVVTPDFTWTVAAGDTVRRLNSRAKVAAFFESPAVTMRRNGKPKTQVTIGKTRRVLRMALTWAEEECRIAKAPLPTTTEKE